MSTSSPNLASAVEALIGASRVLSDRTQRAIYAVDDMVPSVVAKPSSAEEAAEIVRFAAREKLALIPYGARTKLRVGMPPSRYDIALDMTALNQIPHYDPGDLTLSVDAGTSVAKVNAHLLEHNQFLPLLVPWYSLSTVGGAIASGIDSPLRQSYGTARDFLIGAEFIDGTGKLCKSGGRVVKNVTGYDLHKLLIGSLGTLAVITRLNFRTFPAPVSSRGFVASFASAENALALRRSIVESPLNPLTLDILSPSLAQIFAEKTPATPEVAVFRGENGAGPPDSNPSALPPIGDWFCAHEWQLCAAFAGAPEVLERYARDLTRFARESHATSTAILDDSTRPSLWGRLRETFPMLLEASSAATIFKIGVLPSQLASLLVSVQKIAGQVELPHMLVVRAVGTIYFALLPASANDETTARLAQAASQIIQSTSAVGGDTTLLFAPPALKPSLCAPDGSVSPRLNTLDTGSSDLLLMRAACAPDVSAGPRLKSAFDPHNIFVPGRLI